MSVETRTPLSLDAADVGERLDVVVARHLPTISRSVARQLIDDGKVLVNGRAGKASQRLGTQDQVQVEPAPPRPLSAQPEDIPLTIVYRDADLAVLDKPAGLVVHPGRGHASGTLANALAAAFPETRSVGNQERPGIVHRLDKDTSGLMVVALNPAAYASLQGQIAERTADRRYLALVAGRVEPQEGVVEAPVGRDPRNPKRMSVHGIAARSARTSYRVLECLPGFTLIEARLHTGRTHQIRVHLSALGHPLAGDSLYGGPSLAQLERQFLHAYRLRLRSPSTEEILDFSSHLPHDLSTALSALQQRVEPKICS